MLISDFGLCKKLEVDESSFAQTANHAAGSFGYRAPEILRGQVNPNDQTATPSSSTQGSLNGETGNGSPEAAHRLTRSIDIFSLGCIFYYVMTKGEHPFGNRYEREVNILRNEVCLDLLDGLDAESYEVQDLIRSMVQENARARPTAEEILQYPCFWTPARRLLFLCDASDRFEIMERDPPASPLVTLEEPTKVASVVGSDWVKKVDRALVDNLGKYRKYDAGSIRDLLRVLRNKVSTFALRPSSAPDWFFCRNTTSKTCPTASARPLASYPLASSSTSPIAFLRSSCTSTASSTSIFGTSPCSSRTGKRPAIERTLPHRYPRHSQLCSISV